jgi:hypothetical protein
MPKFADYARWRIMAACSGRVTFRGRLPMRSKTRLTAKAAALQAISPLLVHVVQTAGLISPMQYHVTAETRKTAPNIRRQGLIIAKSSPLELTP